MTKEHTVDVLQLAGLTPSMPFLPSWVPNWGHCPQFYKPYSYISHRLARSYLEITSDTRSKRLARALDPQPARPYLEIVPYLEAKHVGMMNSPQPSNTGHLTVQGIYLGTASRDQLQPGGEWQELGDLWLSNKISTIAFRSFYHEWNLDSQPPVGERELSVFLLTDYSTLLVLEPSNNVGEYLLVRAVVSGTVTLSLQRPTEWRPFAFCLLPFLDNELACMENIVAQPNSFSYLGTPPPRSFSVGLKAYCMSRACCRKDLLLSMRKKDAYGVSG
jgi:hypothetical protein